MANAVDGRAHAAIVVAALAWALLLVLKNSAGGVSMSAFAYFTATAVIVLTGWLALLIRRLVRRQEVSRFVGLGPAILLAGCVFASSGLPLSARLRMGDATLRSFAVSASQRGSWPAVPVRVATFWVQEVRASAASVIMITSECGVDPCGFMYAPARVSKPGDDGHVAHLWGPWWSWRS